MSALPAASAIPADILFRLDANRDRRDRALLRHSLDCAVCHGRVKGDYLTKGMMYSDVPNVVFAFGYTNASQTLKCGLTVEFGCWTPPQQDIPLHWQLKRRHQVRDQAQSAAMIDVAIAMLGKDPWLRRTEPPAIIEALDAALQQGDTAIRLSGPWQSFEPKSF